MENVSFVTPNMRASATVPAVARIVRVLDAVSQAREPIGVSELARRTGLNKSSVHGLITALLGEQLLAADEAGRGYVLGPHLLSLGDRARDQHLLEIADVALHDLPLDSGLSAFFGRLDGERITILASRRVNGSLSLSAPIGSSVPVHAGALGQVYLSLLDKQEAVRQLALHPPRQFTDRSLIEPSSLLEATRMATDRGYAVERGAYLPGIAAVAAGIRRSAGMYFMWVVGIDASLDDAQLETLGVSTSAAIARLRAEDEETTIRTGNVRRTR